MALNPRRLMLHVFLTSNFISTNILARSDVTTILLALPIPFRGHQDCPWPHPRDPGASRLASHESLHGATAVRAVRGARHGTISAWRPVEDDRDHERHQRKMAPLSKDQTKRLLEILYCTVLPTLRLARKDARGSVSRLVKLDGLEFEDESSRSSEPLQQSPADL